MAVSKSALSQLGIDAKANDDRRDAKLREELNAVTSVLSDELRAENLKSREAFTNLKGTALGAVEAARSMAASPQIPPRLPSTAVFGAALTQMDGRATALPATVQTLIADFNIVRVQVGDLISARPAQRFCRECECCGRVFRRSRWP